MRVNLILGLEALAPPRTGIGRYTACLLREYLTMPERIQVSGMQHGIWFTDPQALARLCAHQVPADDWRGSALRRMLSYIPGIRIAWQLTRRFRGQALVRRLPKGVIYHEPNYIPPPIACPKLITVHDLSHLRFPQYHPKQRVRWLERELPKALADCAKIITVSEFSRQEIVHGLGVAADKVAVIPLGLEAGFRPPSDFELKAALERYGLAARQYVLSVATLEPRKNLERLLEAYARLPATIRQHFPLVLVGAKGWCNESFWPKLDIFERRGEVRWLGYVQESDLPALYGGAAAFGYVSLYEGFGLPVLEAMGCGAPVLTSHGSAMASWVEDAAVLVDPYDPDAIFWALLRLLEDLALGERLRVRGRKLAERFSWQACALKTLALYAQVAERG